METSQITYDTEVPAPSSNIIGSEQHSGKNNATAYHDYSLPRGATANAIAHGTNSKQYDKPRKPDGCLSQTEGTSQNTATSANGNPQTRNHSTTRNYDVPKDTLNSEVLKCESQSSPPESPTKQPLLHKHSSRRSGHHKGTPRSPPPTIVLSPPEDTSPDKAKVIFEYDNEKFMAKLADDGTSAHQNFLVRYKKSILIIAVTLLMFMLLMLVVLMVYAAHQRR